MNRNYSNAEEKTRRVLKRKKIEAKEVGNVLTDKREVGLVPRKHFVVSNYV